MQRLACFSLLLAAGCAAPPRADPVQARAPVNVGPTSDLAADERQVIARLRVSLIDSLTRRLTARDLQGRGAGQPGGLRAARLLAAAFADAGLSPMPGAATYEHVLPLGFSRVDERSTMTVNGTALRYRTDFLFSAFDMGHAPATDAHVAGEVAFVGFGMTDPVIGRDDLAGIDLAGKVAIVVEGMPAGAGYAETMRNDRYAVVMNLARRGAAAILYLRRELDPATVQYATRRHGTVERVPAGFPQRLPPVALVRAAALQPMFDAGGIDVRALLQRMDSGALASRVIPGRIELDLRRMREQSVPASNVIGFIEGSDVQLRREAIVLTAHYDAYGLDADGTVYPGAGDNALKVGTLVAIAGALRAAAPRRSVIIVAAGAHETSFLLGSFLFVNGGAWPIDHIAAVVNMDGIGSEAWGPLFMLHAMALAETTADTTIADLGRRFGIRIVADDLTSSRIFQRSDHFEYVRRGVPGIYLVGYPAPFDSLGARFGKTFSEVVHFAGDTIDATWHWPGAHDFARFHLLLARRLANAPRAVEWKARSPLNTVRGGMLGSAKSP
jgi:hypothetical protein